jgi:hypothetical protein
MPVVHLVTGGRWHDFEYARERLTAVLGTRSVVAVDHRTWPVELAPDDVLITYTCDLRPDDKAQATLVDFVAGGGRWLALHATHSMLDPAPAGASYKYSAADVMQPVSEVLGSRFLAHPPMAPYVVEITDPDHPLVAGIEPFETRDELYLSELYPPLEVLLHTRFRGPCPSFKDNLDDDEPRPVLYLRRHGAGEVVYLTLGHCRSLAMLHELGKVDAIEADRGSWDLPQFQTLLGRCVDRVLTARTVSDRS